MIVGAFQIFVLFGGSQELRNSVDAAVLNVSKRAVEIKVKIPSDTVYSDCADSTGHVGLSNINRVWGKAYLINANAEAMQKEGQDTTQSNSSATLAYQDAQNINDYLYGMLTLKNYADPHFNQIATNKPARILGNSGTIATSENSPWATSMVYRGGESNISFEPQQLPTGAQVQSIKKGKKSFIRGYAPFSAREKTFCFTTFHSNEMPHLISDRLFKQGRAPIPGVATPIPNAFHDTGETQGINMSASASAVANPQRQFSLAIPHSYVSIQIVNMAKWNVQSKLVSTSTYGYAPETQWGVKNYKLAAPASGILNGYASLGNEYKGATNIWQAFNALPGDHTTPLAKLLQRVQEFKPGFSLTQLKQLMEQQPLAKNTTKFYLYPVYQTPDSSDPEVRLTPSTGKLPSWLAQAVADGLGKVIATEPQQIDEPNYCWDQISGGNSPTGKHWTEVSGQIIWQPGTGYSRCLGELVIARMTECHFTGM